MFQAWLTNIAYFSDLIFGLLGQLWVNCVIQLYLVCWFQNKLELAGTVRLPEMHVPFLQQREKPQLYSVVSIKCHRTSTVIFYRGGIWGLPNFSEGRKVLLDVFAKGDIQMHIKRQTTWGTFFNKAWGNRKCMHFQTELTAKGGEQGAYSIKVWAPTAAPGQPPALLCLCFEIVIELPLEACLYCIVQLGMVYVMCVGIGGRLSSLAGQESKKNCVDTSTVPDLASVCFSFTCLFPACDLRVYV